MTVNYPPQWPNEDGSRPSSAPAISRGHVISQAPEPTRRRVDVPQLVELVGLLLYVVAAGLFTTAASWLGVVAALTVAGLFVLVLSLMLVVAAAKQPEDQP